MKRPDLVDLVSVTCSRSKEQHPSSLFQKDTGDWIKLEPELNTTDVDEDPVYSLQSEAGNFECSVSGLRWSCKEKISFKYQFCSWEGHKEWMENIGYMPAGPLIDITGIVGKFDEVYLPHWICIEDNPKILDTFAVLHIRDCGDAVEKVSEVTSSHVKLSEAVFSPKAAMMKVGFRVKINCNVLIYKTNTAFLTLHIYLIPRDPALQQIMKRRESSYEYKVIRKPHPEKSLKMRDRFILTTDLDDAEICPENLKLRYESTDPNFFEIFIKNPDSDFKLRLKEKNEHQPAWSCVIRKDEYQSSGQTQGNQFVDKHRRELINRVSNIGPVMDDLLSEGVMQQEDYDQIQVIPTTQDKMRRLFCGPLKAGGPKVKDIFYMILEEKEPNLIADLKREE
ncbi:hypothetical protein Q5P01_011610 [Channa striata]|uniref:Uncharacterized protein n=1 Tax=Channa striata TaxID=64152 RepID=A0AA88MTY8_CHASR|nr:hypothetical protein Q5P01_011610 [Channa striata]